MIAEDKRYKIFLATIIDKLEYYSKADLAKTAQERLWLFNANVFVFFSGCSKDNRVSFNKKVMASFKKERAKLSGEKGKFEILSS